MLPTVVIFSNLNFISLHLVRALLAKQCLVIVLTDETKDWDDATSNFKEKDNLKIEKRTKTIKDDLDYFVLVSGFAGETKEEERKIVQDAVNFLDSRKIKSIFVFPFEKREVFEAFLSKSEIKRVYLGGAYGPYMNADDDSPVAEMLIGAATGRKVVIPAHDEDLFNVFAPDAVPDIIRFLFSYGFSGKSVVVSGKTTAYKFLDDIQKILPATLFVQGDKPLDQGGVQGQTFTETRGKTSDSLGVTLDWLTQNREKLEKKEPVVEKEAAIPEKPKTVPTEKVSIKKKKFKVNLRNKKKWLAFSFFFLAVALLSPFVFLAISLGALKFSFDNFLAGRTKAGETLVSVSDFTSSVSLGVSNVLAQIPVLGTPYVYVSDASVLAKEASVIGKRTSATLRETKVLFSNIFNDSEYDITESARVIAVNMELLYQDSSFLQGEIEKMPGAAKWVGGANVDLDRARHMLLGGQAVAKALPQLLGADKVKTYMILFQNSMELRPTGGFIGSFALASFNKGKLSNVEFFDVYTADGQLKGHVEPPAPIRDYLGEANWYLRDSNWDPDFSVSSQRAEWFLDKEIDRSVDGVIGIDLKVPESFLRDTGPVRLADYNQEVDHKNLYEKIQYEVESKFFPGSRNKANILTSLGQAILAKLKEAETIPLEKIGKSTYENLEGRHIQVFLHEPDAAKAISSLGWSGEVVSPACQNANCAGILAGLVEANVGVNKANYFVSRTVSFNSFVGKDSVENTLTVELKNNAPAALGVSGRYKSYVRVITNVGARVKQVGIIESGGTKTVTSETETVSGRVEIGTLVDVAPGAKKSVRFTWTVPVKLDFAGSGNIIYLIRKQAGTGADPVSVKINPPSGVDFLGKTGYNTNLERDLTTSISW